MKYLGFLKSEAGILLFSMVIFIALSYWISYSNFQQRLEREGFCHQQMKEANQPTDACSSIYLAERGAATYTEGLLFPLTVLLAGFLLAPQVRVRRLEERIKALEERSNV